IAEPGDAKRDINVNETFHEQTDDELSEKELKQIEAGDQAIQTILLERKNKLKVYGLRRLRKVEIAQRVESFVDTIMDDQEDASKHGEIIANIDADDDVILKDVAAVEKDDEIEENADVQGRQADATITAASTPITAATLTAAPSAARRRKRIVIRDLEETATPSIIIHSEPKSKDKRKGIMVEDPVSRKISEVLIKADDQTIQTILLGLPEDIYSAVDSCETAQEIWLRVQQMMKGSDIGIQEKKAKLFNEWERFTSNEGESIESYYHQWSRFVTIVHQTKDLHTADYTQLYDFLKYNQKEVDELKAERIAKIQDPLALMANSKNPFASLAPHQDQSPFNQNFLQQPIPNPEDITDPTTAMNMALTLMAKAFKLNYSTLTNNNQRISSNTRNRQIAQPVQNVENQVAQNPRVQNVGTQNGLIGVQENGIQNQTGNGNLVAARAERNAAGQNANQI
nr:hypothetical protein [Tanacetum cinerariifolium]